ncbi:LysM peptidoglycan-binding domain-containing protein [Roseibium polysiphoniae]|uniref:LysM peptidoglycan-binding domain-containing protein n=1 Tax=Roseibium polysiphoniae TaxID=2571221 RepID=A0ABR9C5N7_9HYPH|nr:LysM peptidoglycan-binding domain-containing protein [Roseibium polysiphoniae]MBD8875219.1 LysM peptidoglycan-binding domain-containing protein [Roseibium polysiphoniae]
MTNTALIKAVIAAFFVGSAALVTGYIYSNSGDDDQAPATQSVAESTQEPADTSGEEEVAATSAADDTDSAAEEPDVASAPAETLLFDVVGVEPTGDAVVAGRSEPGAIVALTANGEVVGKGIANDKGEWTIILDEPLPSGDYDVGLQTQNADGTSTGDSSQRLAVSVPEDGTSQPLVVLNSPDAPSTLLQKPELAEAAPSETAPAEAAPEQEQQVAVTEAEETTAPATEAVADAASDVTGDTSPEVGAPAVDETVVAAVEPAAPDVAAEGAEDVVSEAQSEATDEPAPVETASPADPVAKPVREPIAETAAANVGSAEEPAPVQKPSSEAVASTPSPTEEASSDPAALTVTVDAVESEAGKIYVAGTGKAGNTIQVYVADALIGDGVIGSNDRWLIEERRDLAPGSVEVRADMVGADGKVLARAAVTFEKEAEAIVLTKVVASGQSADNSESAGVTVSKPLPNVIIRKGDNLWRISRRLYGDGVRYTTIYQANKKQIRNPDLIYPGQVFLTPEDDLNWAPEQN